MNLIGYLEPMRLRKSDRILGSFVTGAKGRKLVTQSLDADADAHAFYGQLWTAARLVPEAIASGKPYWHLDNGWVFPGRGERDGYYRVTYRSPSPAFIPGTDPQRALSIGARLHPWRQDGRHVLIALPGPNFGAPWGLRMSAWTQAIYDRVRAVTDRPILMRGKDSSEPLARHLKDAWCLVTHSSNVAVDAVLAGVPAVVEASSPTAPLGNIGLEWVERPHLSDRRGEWLSSLCWQQFTPAEMKSGFAWEALQRLLLPVVEQGHGAHDRHDDDQHAQGQPPRRRHRGTGG